MVSMGTDSSHRAKWENRMTTPASSFLIGSSLFLQVTRTTIKRPMGLARSHQGLRVSCT